MRGRETGRAQQGLSPRTRGSLLAVTSTGTPQGSIPAHAGEPRAASPGSAHGSVYPRARGGADAPERAAPRNQGLSPRTRGSPLDAWVLLPKLGSIPAHAGEPGTQELVARLGRVYPRARGGAVGDLLTRARLGGLSPRTRGSHARAPARLSFSRSIPAHAGEPPRCSSGPTMSWVYPRARGGAMVGVTTCTPVGGLSPRTRGSQLHFKVPTSYSRSIPAHAGEPAFTAAF